MGAATIGGIVRAILASLGGILVAKGYADDATVQAAIGGLVTVLTAVWSVVSKRKTPPAA